MYFNNINEIREEYPLLIRYLTEKNRTIDYLPIESAFLITLPDGQTNKKTIEEMQAAENELKPNKIIDIALNVIEKISSNTIKLWT